MKRKKIPFQKKQALMGYVFTLPLILGIIIVFLPALINTIRYSFNEIAIGGGSYTLDWQGIEFYHNALFKDPRFIPLLTEALGGLVIDIPIILIFSLLIAVMLNQKFKGRTIARIVFFIPVILGTGIIASQDEILTAYLTAGVVTGTSTAVETVETTGISDFLMSLNFNATLVEIVSGAINEIYDIVKASGIQILIFLAALQEIPGALYEAASIEGCGKWELFWKITFPMISPQILINLVYTIADAGFRGNVLTEYVHGLAYGGNQYSLAMAMNMIYLVCLAIILSIIMSLLIRYVKNNT